MSLNTWLKHSKEIGVAGFQKLNFSIAQSLNHIVDSPSKTEEHDSLIDLFLICCHSSFQASEHCPLGKIFFRDAPWTDIFKHPTENCATDVSSWIKDSMDTFIPSLLQTGTTMLGYTSVTALVTTGVYLSLLGIEFKRILERAKFLFAQRMWHRIVSNNSGSCDYSCGSVIWH